jgi:AraC-like DNA-binding protein
VGSNGLMSIDLGLRGAVVGLCLLIAGVALRDRRDSPVARLGAALALGAAASAICSAPNFRSPFEWWSLLLLALSGGNAVVFWLWARAAFDDDFEPRWWHGALWAATAGLQLFAGRGSTPALELATEWTLSFAYLGLALLAAGQALATWREDLMAGRRRLRLVVLVGTAVYIGVVVISSLSPKLPPTPSGSGFSIASVAGAFCLCVLVAIAAWNLLRAAGVQEGSVLLPAAGDAVADAYPAALDGAGKVSGIEPALLRRLQHLMAVDRVYRQEGLTIGFLSAKLGVPEYRLRQLINEGLRHRNFNAFLNGYRIEEAKAALANPEQKDVPVLTIALDAGFQSVGPFNRAFKAATDLTPTEFRRHAIAKNASRPPGDDNSGIGKPG